MKKIITITTLLAAGTLLASAETLVLESIIAPTSQNTSGSSFSAWDTIIGTTYTNSKNPTTGVYQYGNGDYESVMYNNTSNGAKTITLESMFVSSGIFDSSQSYELKEFSFVSRSDNGSQQPTYCVQIRTGDGAVVATSGAINYDNAGESGVYGYGSASFDSGVILTADTEYKFYFGTLAGDTFTSAKIGQGVINPYYFSNNLSSSYTVDGYNGYSSVIRLTMSTVPEPSAFGLLAGLVALALAGMRRRRRKA